MEPVDVARLLSEDGEVLLEQVKMPYSEFASGDFYGETVTEPRSATIPPNKIVIKFPQIGPDVYLPAFVTDFDKHDWRKVMGYMRWQREEGNPVEVEGFGGFLHEKEVFPGSDEQIAAGNAQMLRDIQYANQVNTIIATKLDGKDLEEVRAMPLPARAGDVPEDERDWQREVRLKVEELTTDGVITSIDERLPGTWNNYKAIQAELRPGKLMLYSPNDGRGFYVIADQIELWEPGPREPQPSGKSVTWWKFLDMFSRTKDEAGRLDPTKMLSDAGFDTSDITESGAIRQRLAVRRYLHSTGQGRYVARHMKDFPHILEQWAYGEEAEQFGEDIEKVFNLICESRIKKAGVSPGILSQMITEDPDILDT